VLEGSPAQLLGQSSAAAAAVGSLGLILSPAGLGKTTLLVQFGLAEVLAGRPVLHVSLGESISEVRGRYEGLLDDYHRRGRLEDRAAAAVALEQHHMVQSYPRGGFSTVKLTGLLGILAEHASFRPRTILIDGIDWLAASRAQLAACKALAWAHGAALWIAGLSEPAAEQLGPEQLPAPFAGLDKLIDRLLQLRAKGGAVELHVGRGGGLDPAAQHILLDPTYMRGLDDGPGPDAPDPRYPARYTLYSGAAAGSEACFGELAERYGLTEVNFSYPGHEPARQRGLVVLSERELRQGDVSLAYASRRMDRGFEESHALRRVLQTLWHQVHGADQVFVVGEIRDDGTLDGGTGWGGELARLWSKRVSVFDQQRGGWFDWDRGERRWLASDTPSIASRRFCGTGTRQLNDAGRAAIESVFSATFGESAPPSA
jgi:hypothetical protein